MHSTFKTLATAAMVAVATISVQGLPQAAYADDDLYGHVSYAGGTQINALGTTISSDLTAESHVSGNRPASTSNKVASVRVGTLAQIGAVTTDAAAVQSGIGYKTTAHAHTANVSLLNGAIKVSAVDTISTAESNGTDAPTATSSTELIGLTIAGKKYPINVPANTGVTIPGLASIVVNGSGTSTIGNSVATWGAGLYVTLLKPTNGVAAGATIILNPTYTSVSLMKKADAGAALGGAGLGAYAFAHVGDDIQAETGKLGVKAVPPLGTDGLPVSNTTLKVNVTGLLNVKAIESVVTGTSTPALSEATVTSKLVGLKLFPSGLSSLISADAVGSTAHVRLDDGTPVTEGNMQLINLKIAGKAIPIDVAPNTTINLAGLGKIVLNEQTEVRSTGHQHAYRVTALHITLDTARAGLPVGAEVVVGVAQANVYG